MIYLSELTCEQLVLLITKQNKFCTRKPSSSEMNWNARNATNAAFRHWSRMA